MIKNWLHKPFPLIDSLGDQIITASLAGLVVFLFLVIFQPFGISMEHEGIYRHLLGYGVITTVVVFLSFIVTTNFLPKPTYGDNWTIGKNILLIFIILILISVLNFFYGQFVADQIYMQGIIQTYTPGLLLWVFMTFSVGIFPVFFIIYIAEKQLFKRNQRIAKEINLETGNLNLTNTNVNVFLESGKNSMLEFSSNELVCIQAEGGNYSTVYWNDISGLQKEMLRITLQNFMDRVFEDENIIRCHKSYIVNRKAIETVNGNARSLYLKVKGLDLEIPVSRSFPREMLQYHY